MKRIALFPGTFDPFTIGHQSLVTRGLNLVDEIVISIGINDKKLTYFSLEKRIAAIQALYKNEPRVSVRQYNSLTVDFAREMGAEFIMRGIRTVNDFEYEKSIADVNRNIHISAPVSFANCCDTERTFHYLFLKKPNYFNDTGCFVQPGVLFSNVDINIKQ